MKTKPRMSLKKFMTKHRAVLLGKFSKLALHMDRCDVFDLRPMQQGIETALQKAIGPVYEEARNFWGNRDVSEVGDNLHFYAGGMLDDLNKAVEKERLRLEIEKVIQGN